MNSPNVPAATDRDPSGLHSGCATDTGQEPNVPFGRVNRPQGDEGLSKGGATVGYGVKERHVGVWVPRDEW